MGLGCFHSDCHYLLYIIPQSHSVKNYIKLKNSSAEEKAQGEGTVTMAVVYESQQWNSERMSLNASAFQIWQYM